LFRPSFQENATARTEKSFGPNTTLEVGYLGAARVSSADLITCKKSRPAPLTIVITASGANRASENVHAASGLLRFLYICDADHIKE